MKLTAWKRRTVHLLLAAGSVAFLFPFLWLVTTSLKPIEQTMRMPPEWVPRAYYAPIGGETLKVIRERELDQASVVVRIGEGKRRGERVLLRAEKLADGTVPIEVRVGDQTKVVRVAAAVEKEVPAGHWLVREKLELLPHEKGPGEIGRDDILDWRGLAAAILEQRDQDGERPGKRLWAVLPGDARQALEDAAGGADLGTRRRLAIRYSLNDALERRDLYGEAAFAGLDLPLEAREFLERQPEAVTDQQTRRLNRLLLETAFPGLIASTVGQRLVPRWDCVAAEAIEERAELAWHNYDGAIRYTGYYEFALFGHRLRVPNFLLYTYNTLVVAVLGMIGVTLSSALTAYGFARIRWPGRDTCFLITLSTMMIPFAVTMIPLYAVFRTLGWIGTLKPLWVPAFFGGAFNVFLLRQFFLTIPQDLSDAARIDGCSEFGIFWRIILPLSKPALAVVCLFHFMWAWRDLMGPLIFLTEKHTYTLSLGLHAYQSQHGGSEWHYLMAASTLMILPVIILFFFTQRTFIQGISTTGMKG